MGRTPIERAVDPTRDGVLRRTARVQQLGASAGDKVNELIAEITVEIAMVTANCL